MAVRRGKHVNEKRKMKFNVKLSMYRWGECELLSAFWINVRKKRKQHEQTNFFPFFLVWCARCSFFFSSLFVVAWVLCARLTPPPPPPHRMNLPSQMYTAKRIVRRSEEMLSHFHFFPSFCGAFILTPFRIFNLKSKQLQCKCQYT